MQYVNNDAALKWLGPSSSSNQNQVRSVCAPGNPVHSCSTKDFPITSYKYLQDMRVGALVCNTGAGDQNTDHQHRPGAKPGTRCGEITNVDELVETNTCTRQGDSGGPLFSQIDNKAYGIVKDGTPSWGACPPTGNEYSFFSPVHTILLLAKQRTGHRFAVIGAPFI